MKYSFPGASLAAIGLLSLLSACASTSDSSNDAGSQKVASTNCEVVGPTIGSNVSHRSCVAAAPAPAAQSEKAATAQ